MNFQVLEFTPCWTHVLACVTLFAVYWFKIKKRNGPGPRGLPLLGVTPYLSKDPEKDFAKWSRQYGKVLSVDMGSERWVILHGLETIKQAFVKNGDVLSDRPVSGLLGKMTDGHGIAFINGQFWKSQRKFGLLTLRGFGFGKSSMEDSMLEEADYLVNEIRSKKRKPFDPTSCLPKAVSNIICRLVFGKRFQYDDPSFNELLHILQKWFSSPQHTAKFQMLMFAEWLRFFPPFSGVMKEMKDDIARMIEIIDAEVTEHEKDLSPDSPRDFIDAFLVEMAQKKEHFTRYQLLHYIRDLFEAGSETTSSTLAWSLLCMLHYPNTQKKLYEEIVSVLGEDGRATYAMKDKFPYCMAFIQEAMRFRTLTPLSVPHAASQDLNLGDVHIPKGTTVTANLWALHNDPELWNEPEKFDPDRHIDSNGLFVKSANVIPFNIGQRYCLGEQLARMELLVFLIEIVRKFEFLPDPDSQQLPEIDVGANGVGFCPLPYKLVAKERC